MDKFDVLAFHNLLSGASIVISLVIVVACVPFVTHKLDDLFRKLHLGHRDRH